MPEQTLNSIQQAAKLLDDTRQVVLELLEDKPMIKNFINNNFNIMLGRLAAVSGGKLAGIIKKKAPLEPVTVFMGEIINRKKPLEVKDLTPDEAEKANIREKADKLQNNFLNLTNEKILEAWTTDPIVLRLIAKRVGVEDFREAEINDQYITNIRNAMKEQDAVLESKEDFEAGLNKSTPEDDFDEDLST